MVTVTKREAVQILIRGAIRAFKEGDSVCTLTLAGGAEGAMPSTQDLTAYEVFKIARRWSEGGDDQEAGRTLNVERNWLKHYNQGEPAAIDITMAGQMLFRTISRYLAVYGLDDFTTECGEFLASSPDLTAC